MLFLLRFVCLVSSPDISKFLNQEGFYRKVKIVLFSEEKKSKLSEFLLIARKIICQWDKQNNLISNRKQYYYFADPIGTGNKFQLRLLVRQSKTTTKDWKTLRIKNSG